MSEQDREEKQASERRAALARAYQDIFLHHPGGKLVLADLLCEAGILQINFVGGDPQATAYNDGRRSLALTILRQLRWSETELLHWSLKRREDVYNPIAPDAGNIPADDQDEMENI